MKEKVLFLKSPLKEKIYGGTRIQEKFGFQDKLNLKIGEYWAISAHDNGPSIIANGDLAGKTLKEVYDEKRELFANSKEEKFPLLVKINEITSPVSVQVHPNDEYAKKYEDDLGKSEFCLYLNVEPGTNIIHGHNAKTKAEFSEMIVQQNWDDLFIRKPVTNNDYVFTPSGVVHGVEGKMMLVEVQQSSDITYRIYDYDNVDVDGKPRELHIDKAIETTCIPHENPKLNVKDEVINNNRVITYVDNEVFKVTRYFIQNQMEIINDKYSLCLVLSGEGKLKLDTEYELSPGTSFVVTSNSETYAITGNIELLVSEPPKK